MMYALHSRLLPKGINKEIKKTYKITNKNIKIKKVHKLNDDGMTDVRVERIYIKL